MFVKSTFYKSINFNREKLLRGLAIFQSNVSFLEQRRNTKIYVCIREAVHVHLSIPYKMISLLIYNFLQETDSFFYYSSSFLLLRKHGRCMFMLSLISSLFKSVPLFLFLPFSFFTQIKWANVLTYEGEGIFLT